MLWLWCACLQDSEQDTRAFSPTVYEPPSDLQHWLTGNPEDIAIETTEALLLIGGGREPDEGFVWWNEHVHGGDVVILRVSGSDGYNEYLYTDIGGLNSVETLKIDSQELANDPYVVQQLTNAEGVFVAGGDQWDYLSLWRDTLLHEALQEHVLQGKPIGGTSAGLAILGSWIFSAQHGTVYSDEVLLDPYNEYVQISERFLSVSSLEGAITDSHFSERERLGRLIGFVGRLRTEGKDVYGLGIDESTASLLGAQAPRVVGEGAVIVVQPEDAPLLCVQGEPLVWSSIPVIRRTAQGEHIEMWGVSEGVTYQE